MSSKHYFPETSANTLVPRYLRALTRLYPHLSLIESEKVVYDPQHDPECVSIISGGGSGHEPGWSGYVGKRALAAAVCGDIFASPSTKQILAAMRATPSKAGYILALTNYTGDKLHFGLACERAKAEGLSENIAMLHLTDDVSIGRSKCGNIGRRGMPGHVVPMKILGAAAGNRYPFEKCVEIGQAVNAEVVSIGSALDQCHVPGRKNNMPSSSDVCFVGAGIHNEPSQKITPFPTVEDLIDRCLRLLCDPEDHERHFVTFDNGDLVVLVINNYGGLSNLELGALADETIMQLETKWDIEPTRILSGDFETSLNAPGFSISLCNLTAAGRGCSIDAVDLLHMFDAPTTSVAWPNVSYIEPIPAATNGNVTSKPTTKVQDHKPAMGIQVAPALLESAVRFGCQRAIASEPSLTKWDMILGDGDCGEAVLGVCQAMTTLLDEGAARNGSILSLLSATTAAVDDMGGTLGAIIGILLSAFSNSLQQTSPCSSAPISEILAKSLHQATEVLKTHTGAREGDRTVMDVLLPFTTAFAAPPYSFENAVKVAREKADGTRFLKASFGRATYVAEGDGQDVPDPGAWALYEILQGVCDAVCT